MITFLNRYNGRDRKTWFGAFNRLEIHGICGAHYFGAFPLLLPLNFKYTLHLRVLKTARRIEDVPYLTRI